MHKPAIASIAARLALWASLAFVLNLLWEIAQVRLYTIWDATDGVTVAWALLHCTLGDVMISLAWFALVGTVLRRVDWPSARPWTGGAMVAIGALAFTVWSEWHNVYRAGNWGYTAAMPLIFGIGLAPLTQWLVLPPVMVCAFRKIATMPFHRHGSTNGFLRNFTKCGPAP